MCPDASGEGVGSLTGATGPTHDRPTHRLRPAEGAGLYGPNLLPDPRSVKTLPPRRAANPPFGGWAEGRAGSGRTGRQGVTVTRTASSPSGAKSTRAPVRASIRAALVRLWPVGGARVTNVPPPPTAIGSNS